MNTIKDVAALAKVSVSTASLALNGKAGVSQRTRKRVMVAAEQLRYIPNSTARSLIKRRSNKIGFIVTDIANPFFGMLTKEINSCVQKYHYDLLIGVSEDKMHHEVSMIERFIEARVEGVILVPTIQPEYDLKHLHQLKTHNIPLVFSTAAYKGISSDCVMCDLGRGTYLLTSHLLKNGHRKIYIFTGNRTTMYSAIRIEGCIKAYREYGMDFKEEWIIESRPFWEGGYKTTLHILDMLPDAIITVNDVMAMGVLKCLKEHNVKVPADVSVAGYDDLEYTSILETPLTTVRQPIAEIAHNTVERIMARINGDVSTESTLLIEPVLKLRETTLIRLPLNS